MTTMPMHFCSSESGASFQELVHDVAVLHPSMEEKGMTTMRLQRLHFSSSPCPQTLAISCPHLQRVSSDGMHCFGFDFPLTIGCLNSRK